MERKRLIRKLNSVGKEAFVSHYYLFKDYVNNKISKDSAIKELVDESRSNEAGASIRLGNARSIFTEMSNCEALMMVQESKRLSQSIVETANKIYRNDCE